MKWVIWVLYIDVHVHVHVEWMDEMGNMGTVHVEWMDEMGNMGTVHRCTCTCIMHLHKTLQNHYIVYLQFLRVF